ncbi:TPA: hypothetical protein ACLIVI_005426 [Bacillus pacificus]
MKFLNELYPYTDFYYRQYDQEDVMYGFDRSNMKNFMATENYVFIKANDEHNVNRWVFGDKETYYTLSQFDEFTYVVEKTDVEEMYEALDTDFDHLLIDYDINSFEDFKRARQIPERTHTYVSHILKMQNLKNTILRNGTWEAGFEYQDGSSTNVIMLEREEYLLTTFNPIIIKQVTVETSTSISNYVVTTSGELYQIFHSYCEDELFHHATMMRQIEDENEKEKIQTLFLIEG